MLMLGEIDTDERDEVIDLEFDDIDQTQDEAALLRWYDHSRELCDDIIVQLEVEEVTNCRGSDWVRRASGVLIGLKKKMRRIERRCVALGFSNPRPPKAKPEEVKVLLSKIGTARYEERTAIVEWLAETFGDEAGPAIKGITNRLHRRTLPQEAA